MDVEECEACKRIVDMSRLLQTPLGYYICEDSEECIASFSGWDKPIKDDAEVPHA